jgi:hypothetical protein
LLEGSFVWILFAYLVDGISENYEKFTRYPVVVYDTYWLVIGNPIFAFEKETLFALGIVFFPFGMFYANLIFCVFFALEFREKVFANLIFECHSIVQEDDYRCRLRTGMRFDSLHRSGIERRSILRNRVLLRVSRDRLPQALSQKPVG